ncbi:MAG: 1-deoxy-D-xylulose-5-phosphate reductoisomerase [Treponema sp.]|nr:1-deoxy-D-xylulose-5-phosphate reductoisomerase [Treponema sp.]
MKKVAVLGATGSIGKSSLDVLRANKNDFEPVLFTAHTDLNALLALKKEFPKALAVLSGAAGPVNYCGRQGLLEAIAGCGADIIINGIAGADGLEPSIAALSNGRRLALANKETIVMAGPLVFALAKEKNAKIIPVDSEHSAIFQLIQAHGKDNIDEIILTASGGPFKNFSIKDLEKVTADQALAHPTWSMGPKITIDSATLANKGLEVIEAVRLFDFDINKIRVVIHPQSIVHSMVRLKNGNIYAQMSKPDMRHPIQNALYWPKINPYSLEPLDFGNLTLEFGSPDTDRFPMLALAYRACAMGIMYPAIYNAANEAAVQLFLDKKIRFLDIHRIVGYVLSSGEWSGQMTKFDLENILIIDRKAREMAVGLIGSKKWF